MSEHARHSSEKISEALQLLEEAAKDKKDEIREMIAKKYGNVQEILAGEGEHLSDALKKAKAYASERAHHAQEAAIEKAKEVGTAVNKEVHRNPWPYIGVAAVGGLLLGFILGRKSS